MPQSDFETFTQYSGQAAEGIAKGLLFTAVPLLMMGLAIGIMKQLIRIPIAVVGGSE